MEYVTFCWSILGDCNVVWQLQRAPNVLVLHLKRFTNSSQKIEGRVLFEGDLELTPYMSTNAADGYVPIPQCISSR